MEDNDTHFILGNICDYCQKMIVGLDSTCLECNPNGYSQLFHEKYVLNHLENNPNAKFVVLDHKKLDFYKLFEFHKEKTIFHHQSGGYILFDRTIYQLISGQVNEHWIEVESF